MPTKATCPMGGKGEHVAHVSPPGSFARCVICLTIIDGRFTRSSCSQRCSRQLNRWPRPRTCDACGCELGRNRSKYCSEQCRTVTGKLASCGICGQSFRRTPKRLGSCSPECAAELIVERNRRKNRRRRNARQGVQESNQYTRNEIAERDSWKCHLCGKTVNARLSGSHPFGPTVDHLIPISAGGDDTLQNVALAHRRCNIVRGAGGEVQLRLTG